MINDIINAIAIKLNGAFGDNYTIYTEQVEQGFEAPAFLILFLNLEQVQQIGKRWRIDTLFNVQYFSAEGRTDASSKTLDIQQALKVVTLLNGNVMRGTGANSEIIDGNAHNFIRFNFFLQEVEVQDFMESLEQNRTLKG